jgi:hypothetical protein
MKHRSGTICECELPEGYDDRTRIAMSPTGLLVVAHPDFAPAFYNKETKSLETIVPMAQP